jgi:hypothetical protein
MYDVTVEFVLRLVLITWKHTPAHHVGERACFKTTALSGELALRSRTLLYRFIPYSKLAGSFCSAETPSPIALQTQLAASFQSPLPVQRAT